MTKTIITSFIVTLLTAWVTYNFIPLHWLDYFSFKYVLQEVGLLETPFGATITTINATDLISDSRSTINTNFTNLNNNKIEMSTTSVKGITTLSSLASIGTITTGVWNATAIGVGYGGTGTTSPALFHILVGSSTNGVGIVSGLGTSGQFLTSQGAGLPPQWTTSSIDEAGNYAWTGNHNFTAAGTYIKNLNASSTAANPIILNGISYAFPVGQGASSTVLATDGSGNLSFQTLNPISGITTRNDGSTGAQQITHNLGRVPQFIRITTYGTSTTGGTPGIAAIMESVGTATSISDEKSLAKVIAVDNDNGTDAGVATLVTSTSSRIVWLTEINTSAACLGENDGSRAYANISAITNTTFTLNWDYNCDVSGVHQYHIMWEVW